MLQAGVDIEIPNSGERHCHDDSDAVISPATSRSFQCECECDRDRRAPTSRTLGVSSLSASQL